MSPRLPVIESKNANDYCDSETNFKRDLLYYLESYKLPVLQPWIDRVKSADFREVKYENDRLNESRILKSRRNHCRYHVSRVYFVASIPGTHSKRAPVNWGQNKMTELLSKHAVIPSENAKDWPLYYQCSSIGSQGKDPYVWFLGEFTRTMQSGIKCCSFQPPAKLVRNFVALAITFLLKRINEF